MPIFASVTNIFVINSNVQFELHMFVNGGYSLHFNAFIVEFVDTDRHKVMSLTSTHFSVLVGKKSDGLYAMYNRYKC